MERLTNRRYGEISCTGREMPCSSFCNNCSQGTGNCEIVKRMVEKLAEYEDLEEQGRLLKHNIDRDSMLKYFADMLTAFAEVASIQNYETNHTCDSQHNNNPKDNKPCCRCDDSRVSENDDTINKVTSLEIIVRMIDSKPYYEIKYKKVDEDYYHVGYSSYNLDNVLKWRDECFELVESDREERSEKSE